MTIRMTKRASTIGCGLLFVAFSTGEIVPALASDGLSCAVLFSKRPDSASRGREIQTLLSLANSVASPREQRMNDEQLGRLLHADESNIAYFKSLVGAYRQASGKQEKLRIFDGKPADADSVIVYPTAIAPKELLAQLPYVNYQDLRNPMKGYRETARGATLWVEKMQAGTGSSMTRQTYIAAQRGVTASQVRIGAKGTDLVVELPGPGGTSIASIAELQMLQLMREGQSGHYRSIVFHDIVSHETANSVRAIWAKPSYFEPGKTYSQVVEGDPRFIHFRVTDQAYMPTLNEKGEVTTARMAPGGHALFAVEALRAAYKDEMRPKVNGDLVSVIGNGEDLSSTPSPEMVGWMVRENIPIVMVTTEKTPIDLKGGQIALAKNPSGQVYVTIVEQAQAKKAGQVELFEKLGLEIKEGDQIAFFNTNMALFNYRVLAPKIKMLVEKIGEEKFMEVIAPDLIMNWKEQTDVDGVVRKYLQLEGAMGSTLLRLDQYWRAHFNEPLVHFINVDKGSRTDFFSPIKTAFDFFMQFHSDRFGLDTRNMVLVNRKPGRLPTVALKDSASEDKYYQDVLTVLTNFKGLSILELEHLSITGKVALPGLELRGRVSVTNKSAQMVDVSALVRGDARFARDNGRIVLENVSLEIDESGRLTKVSPN
jgi:UDP-N-acetylglucosamine pyrophosphorylase